MLEKLAPAKINLVLEVLGERSDGYHEIKSIMQTINICDRIMFEPDESVSLNTDIASLPNEDNLIYRAALLLKNSTGVKRGAKITLEKRIPEGAGFGGGSSDAATTLLSLNDLWELKLSTSDLLELSSKLGSDVPFFIQGGTGLIEGRGEKVIPLKCVHNFWYVVSVPDIRIEDKTKKMYSLLTKDDFSNGEHINAILKTLEMRERVDRSMFHNVFDKLGLNAFPEIRRCWNVLVDSGINYLHLSGSGPSIFSAFTTSLEARNVCSKVRKAGINAFSAKTFS